MQLNVAQSAVTAAQADLVAAQAQARATEGQMRSLRFSLDHAIEDVNNQIALLRSKVATLESQKAALVTAQADYDRAKPLVDHRRGDEGRFRSTHARRCAVATGASRRGIQGVYQVRVSLGLPPQARESATISRRCRPISIRHFRPFARRR